MKRLVVASLMALSASIVISNTASAQNAFAFPYSPYGFGFPVALFGGANQTSPYFAMHPPVYYGARYVRPYGISPFPAPPGVSVPDGYIGSPAARFYQPPVPAQAPSCNPYIIGKSSETKELSTPKMIVVGEIQTNPFVESAERLARR